MTFLGYLAKMPNNMDRKTRARFEARANIIKAMGHPTRLFIVEELSRAERSVSELTKMIGADVSTVSKHLAMDDILDSIAELQHYREFLLREFPATERTPIEL